jgi:hypothetical protein
MKLIKSSCVLLAVLLSSCTFSTEYVPVPLTPGVSTRQDALDFFGSEPFDYIWDKYHYTADTLPSGPYIMRYNSSLNTSFDICVINSAGSHVIWELRFKSPEYRCLGSLTVGLTKEEVFALVGNPVETRTGVAINYSLNDVFFQDYDGNPGKCYYKCSTNKVRMWFSANKTVTVYIYGAGVPLERWKPL